MSDAVATQETAEEQEPVIDLSIAEKVIQKYKDIPGNLMPVLQGVQALLHGGRRGLIGDFLSALSHQLVKSRHGFPPFLENGSIYTMPKNSIG